MHIIFYTMQNAYYIFYNAKCILYFLQCQMHIIFYTMQNAYYIFYNVKCILYFLQCQKYHNIIKKTII